MHYVVHIAILGVRLGPMPEAELVVIVDLVIETRHPSVFGELFLSMEVEPRVPCMCMLGLVLILVGEEFDGGTFANCGVLIQ